MYPMGYPMPPFPMGYPPMGPGAPPGAPMGYPFMPGHYMQPPYGGNFPNPNQPYFPSYPGAPGVIKPQNPADEVSNQFKFIKIIPLVHIHKTTFQANNSTNSPNQSSPHTEKTPVMNANTNYPNTQSPQNSTAQQPQPSQPTSNAQSTGILVYDSEISMVILQKKLFQ